MHSIVNCLQLSITKPLAIFSLWFASFSTHAHPGHGKSFGSAEDPTIVTWVWMTIIGVLGLIGIWRLYSAIFRRKKKPNSESN